MEERDWGKRLFYSFRIDPFDSNCRQVSGDQSPSMMSVVKGIAPTSKLMGKLHSMRAQQDGGPSPSTMSSDPDDKWDWMTGVPTSIR